MRQQLERFDNLAARYGNTLAPGEYIGDRALWHQLWRSEPTIRKIFSVLDARLDEEFDLNRTAGEATARNLVQRALGILDDMDEWATRLGPDAPTLPADRFHPWVWGVAHTFWDNAHTQTKIGRQDISDGDLMNHAFTEKPKPGQAYLQLPGDLAADRTLKNRNRAIRPFAEGCFAGIRNPATHEHGADWDEQRALEYLAALSILARWIDECVVLHGT